MKVKHLLVIALTATILGSPTLGWAQAGWGADWIPLGEVERAVRTLRAPLYDCYRKHVPEESRMHGDVATLRVVVSEEGKVFRVDFLEGSTRSKKFDACLRALFEGLSFETKPATRMSFVQKIGFQNGLDKMLIEPPHAAGGAITKESATAMAQARAADIQACYQRALSSNPELRGQVLVEIVVDGSRGTVKEARVVKSTLGHAGTESCVLGVVRTFAFPVPEDPGLVILQFPLTFDDDAK